MPEMLCVAQREGTVAFWVTQAVVRLFAPTRAAIEDAGSGDRCFSQIPLQATARAFSLQGGGVGWGSRVFV